MKKEKTVLQITHSAGEYTAPKIKVKELRRTRKVLCASDGSSTDEYIYRNGNDEGLIDG